MAKINALNEIAKKRGESLAQMALAWILRDGDITSVLIGASKPAQILDNIGMLNASVFTEAFSIPMLSKNAEGAGD